VFPLLSSTLDHISFHFLGVQEAITEDPFVHFEKAGCDYAFSKKTFGDAAKEQDPGKLRD